jgi:replicative DNA helicase
MIEDILEQEALVIGSLMNNSERLDETDLTPEDFSSVEHKQYFECINQCAAENNLNVFSVKESFVNETGVTDNLLLDYANSGLGVTINQFKQYVQRIKKESIKNKALAITSELIDGLNIGNNDSIGSAISKLMNVDKSGAKYDHSFTDVADSALKSLERLYSGESDSIKTGFSDIDECIGGWHNSDLIIIPARPAQGKTAFMVNSFLKCSAKVGVISGEQGAEQIGVRSVCIEGGVNHQNFRRAKLSDDEFDRLGKAVEEFKIANGRIYDKPAPTILDVEKIARQWVYKRGVQILFIDYAQRLDHENKKLSRLDKMSDIAMRLKELARTLNIPVIALAQVNRQCEQREDKRPRMSDIADASAFEKEADIIFTLYRDEVYDEDSPEKGIIEANFEKNRHGSTGRVKLSWKGQTMQVGDFTGYEISQQETQDYTAYQSDGFLPQ